MAEREERKRNKQKTKKILCLSVVAVSISILLFYEISGKAFCDDTQLNDIIYNVVTRSLGGVICIMLMWYCSFIRLLAPCKSRSFIGNILLTLPCWLVVINNFPFIAYFTGAVEVTSPWYFVALYALECFCIGLFEETAFRGCIFMLMLQRKDTPSQKWNFISIVVSSAVFGLVHLANLLAGAGIVPVLMQIGYSFLIGGMCSVVLLRTGNLWYCILLHGIYNFCGGVIPELGKGKMWDMPTVIITAVLATAVTVYMMYILYKTPANPNWRKEKKI